jgi:hypothetical protein
VVTALARETVPVQDMVPAREMAPARDMVPGREMALVRGAVAAEAWAPAAAHTDPGARMHPAPVRWTAAAPCTVRERIPASPATIPVPPLPELSTPRPVSLFLAVPIQPARALLRHR